MLILESPWTRQPQVAVGVNWSNPLARGLVFSMLPPQGDAVAGGMPQYVGTAVRTPRQRGLAFVADDTTNDAVAINGGPGLYGITSAFTLSIWIEPLTVVDYTNYFSVPYRASGWSAPYNSLTVFRDAATSKITSLTWAYSATQNSQFNATSEIITYGAGSYANYLWTRNSAAECVLYKNGVAVYSGSATVNAAIDWNEKRPVTMLNHSSSSPGEGWTGLYDGCDIWNRALSAPEVSAYYRNRFQLFAPQQIIIPTPAAATVPTLSASTYVPGSMTSTGWRPQITAS